MDTFLLDDQLRRFLREDLEHGDITTDAIFDDQVSALATLKAREPMVVAGMEAVAARVFCLLDGGTLRRAHSTPRPSGGTGRGADDCQRPGPHPAAG